MCKNKLFDDKEEVTMLFPYSLNKFTYIKGKSYFVTGDLAKFLIKKKLAINTHKTIRLQNKMLKIEYED